MGKHQIQIRFNTDKEKLSADLPPWRVLIDGVEHFAQSVHIEVPSATTEDLLPSGQRKWHISCEGDPYWMNDVCVIR